MAVLELRVMFAMMIQRYKITLDFSHKHEYVYSATLGMKHGVKINLQER